MNDTLLAAVLTAVLAGLGGLLVPRLIARLPEPVPKEEPGDEPEHEPEPPKVLYADIAARPGLGWRSAVGAAVAGALVGAVTGLDWSLLWLVPLVPVGIALSVVDWHTKLLPRVVVLPATLAAILLVVVVGLVTDEREALVRALLAMVVAIISQKVTGMEARRAYKGLVRSLAEPAPGPPGDAGMSLPPDPGRLAAMPYWAFHRFGVERRRADTVRRAAAVAGHMEAAAALPGPDARRRLQVLPGIGPWTSAVVGLVALGDADAVPVGDFHIPHQVSWALAGEPRGSDERMLELLEPYRGHRGRVVRLIVAGGYTEPKYGPRTQIRSIARI